MLWRRMLRKQEDPSSITEVLVCSALEVPTMWGKLGFLRVVTPRICWGERQLTLGKWRRKSGRMTEVVQSVCGEVSSKWWRAWTWVNCGKPASIWHHNTFIPSPCTLCHCQLCNHIVSQALVRLIHIHEMKRNYTSTKHSALLTPQPSTYKHYTPSTTNPTAFHDPPMHTTNKHNA